MSLSQFKTDKNNNKHIGIVNKINNKQCWVHSLSVSQKCFILYNKGSYV